MKYLLSLFVAGLAGAGFFAVLPAHAASVGCVITTADINKITAIQNDPTLTYSQEITQELALRKQLVGQTIGCAQQDLQALQAELQAASVDSDSQALQTQLLGRINDGANFYSIELANLDNAGIAGTQVIAKEVLDWRKSTFTPLSGEVTNFLLWAQNQSLFNTAQTRMDQTQRAVSFLESASQNSDLQDGFNTAVASFAAAQNENNAAKAALAQSLPPDQSLALIKQSLDDLPTTYQNFFTVSALIKGILPQ